MASLREQEITLAIGLTGSFHRFNGSASCGDVRRTWIQKYPRAVRSFGLQVDPTWLQRMQEADAVDQVETGDFGLTNVWIAICYAVQSALRVADGGEPIDPMSFHFHRRTTEGVDGRNAKRQNCWDAEVVRWILSRPAFAERDAESGDRVMLQTTEGVSAACEATSRDAAWRAHTLAELEAAEQNLNREHVSHIRHEAEVDPDVLCACGRVYQRRSGWEAQNLFEDLPGDKVKLHRRAPETCAIWEEPTR